MWRVGGGRGLVAGIFRDVPGRCEMSEKSSRTCRIGLIRGGGEDKENPVTGERRILHRDCLGHKNTFPHHSLNTYTYIYIYYCI